jgi:hypothetical protein
LTIGENEIAPATFQKVRHHRRVVAETVLMAGKTPRREDGVKRREPMVMMKIATAHISRWAGTKNVTRC